MGVNLTPGAITKLMTDKCTSDDLKPVVQLINIDSRLLHTKDNKPWYLVWLSDGSFWQIGFIAEEIFISKQLQKGSIVQLTMYQFTKLFSTSCILVFDLTVIHNKYDIIGDPKLLPDNSHHVEEPPTSLQNLSTSMQKCSSHSPTQNKKRKLQSSDDAISVFGKDISHVMKMMMGITNDVRVLYRKVEKLDEDVSKMTKMMMDKNKDDVGACFKKLETLEENVSKMTRMMMERKEDDMGACIEKLDKMGWGAEEPIYDTALLLFLKGADYRKLWLHLKPECCGKWVKIAGSIFGLLD